VAGEVRFFTTEADTNGTPQSSLIVEGVSGTVVYLAQSNALIDSMATDGGTYAFDGLGAGTYQIVTWIVPSGVVSSESFEIRDEPIYRVVPIPIADPQVLEPAVFERAAPRDPRGLAGDIPTPGTPVDSLALFVYPNPSSAAIQIEYALAVDSMVGMVIENSFGTPVRQLVSAVRPAGIHLVTWDGTDSNGQALPPDAYIVTIATDTTEGWELILREAATR